MKKFKYQTTGDNVILEDIPTEDSNGHVKRGGVLVPKDFDLQQEKNAYVKVKVLGKGPMAIGIEVGDLAVINRHNRDPYLVEMGKESYLVMRLADLRLYESKTQN